MKNTGDGGKVTLRDIAKQAGVSKSAVSKALHGAPDIGDETRNRILEIVESMGYSPSNMARSLRTGRTHLLGVLVPNSANVYYSAILQGIESTVKKYNYTVVINNTGEDPEIETAALRSLLNIPVDGIISVPVRCANYQELLLPHIFISRYPYRETMQESQVPNLSYVLNDDYLGQYLATTHLIERGFRNLVLVIDAAGSKNVHGTKSRIRIDAFKNAIKEHHTGVEPVILHTSNESITEAYLQAKKHLEITDYPIAFSATNDSIAIGILHAIHEKSLAIPTQAAVIGYDDVEFSAHLIPPLTTVHISKENMGSLAARTLLDNINNPQASDKILLKPYVIQRHST